MFPGQEILYVLAAAAPLSLGVILFMAAFSGRFSAHGRSVRLSTLVFAAWTVATIIFTPYTFALRLPGLPDLSIERMLFVALIAATLSRIYRRDYVKPRSVAVEAFMFLFCAWCLVSMARFGFVESYSAFARPSYVFMAGYVIPFLTFAYVKRFLDGDHDKLTVLRSLFWFGGYLSLIAYLEHYGLTQFVVPSYITDPELSQMHLDRSRGPFLNAAFNGLALNITFLCGVMAMKASRWPGKWMYWLVLALHIPAIYFTRTRSVYVHLLMTLFVLMFVYRSRLAGWKLLPVIVLVAGIGLGANWERITSGSRELGGIGQVKEVGIRFALAEKSLNSILEHPFGGIGLAQFRTASLFTPGDVEFQHNHLIGMAVELGLPGLGLYLMILLLLFVRTGSLLGAVPETELLGVNFVLLLATALFVDLINNFFVEPSLHLFANMNFFLFAGMIDGLYCRYCRPVRGRFPA